MKLLNRLRSDSGQAILEAALLMPVFALLGFLLIDIEWMTRDAAAIEYIVNEAARCEAIQSAACSAPANVQTYATQLAANLRLDTGTNFQLSTPACTPSLCSVSIVYAFKPLGAWFPPMTISRTGSAAVPPSPGPGAQERVR
jgi:hypothetical protein